MTTDTATEDAFIVGDWLIIPEYRPNWVKICFIDKANVMHIKEVAVATYKFNECMEKLFNEC